MTAIKISLFFLGTILLMQEPRTAEEVAAIWRKAPGAAASQDSRLISSAVDAYNELVQDVMSDQPSRLAQLRLSGKEIVLIEDKRVFLQHVMGKIWKKRQVDEEVEKAASAFVINSALPIIVDLRDS